MVKMVNVLVLQMFGLVFLNLCPIFTQLVFELFIRTKSSGISAVDLLWGNVVITPTRVQQF